MNVLTTVFFRAKSGGLHENLRATITLLVQQGHDCTLMCRGGSFAEEIKELGVTVVTTDFTEESDANAIATLEALHRKRPFDLVHTHPFYSRKIAQRIAQKWALPLLTTIHGRYTDELESNYTDFSTIFAVSEGIRDYLIDQVGPGIRDRLLVAPNGVKLSRFPAPRWRADNDQVSSNATSIPTIALVSRFDKDKQFILDTFVESVESLLSHGVQFKLMLVGAGNQQEALVDKLIELLPEGTDARGWLAGDDLVRAYKEADIVVAPGRCALEAMASGKPTIAIGSKGYVGLIDESNWQQGVYTNFGGVGNKENDYPEDAIAKDIEPLLTSTGKRLKLGQLGRQLVELFYDEDLINQKVIGVYSMLALGQTNINESKAKAQELTNSAHKSQAG